MKLSTLALAAFVCTSVAATASAQTVPTLKKVADSGKITLSYREASVPFSYLIGSTKAIGFSVEIAEAIVDDVRKKNQKADAGGGLHARDLPEPHPAAGQWHL